MPQNGESIFGRHEAGTIEDSFIDDYKKIREAAHINEIKSSDEQKEALSTEEINIRNAIEESLKLNRIRGNNRKVYEKELQRGAILAHRACGSSCRDIHVVMASFK